MRKINTCGACLASDIAAPAPLPGTASVPCVLK
jgi:hypothetical protein